jgi:hypothetical protein
MDRSLLKDEGTLLESMETSAKSVSNVESDSIGAHAARKTESGARNPARNSPRSVVLQSNFHAQPVFSRVTGATLHMDHRPARHFAKILTLLGYAKGTSGEAMTLSAHGFTLKILPEEYGPSGYRLSAVRLAMSRLSVAPMTFVFAPGSRLVLNADMTADWEFGL